MITISRHKIVLCMHLIGMFLLGTVTSLAAAQSSANYSMKANILVGGGGAAAADGYSSKSAAGQSSAIGQSSSSSYALSAGFFPPLPARPSVTTVSPANGPTGGGTSVTVTGTNLSDATAVKFGASDATSFIVNSNTQITATSPAASAGTVHVTVTSAGGISATSSADQFTYVAYYTVNYDGNGNTGGTVPTDGSSPYASGATVTVLGNAGSLVKTGYTLSGWNSAPDGSGTDYAPAETFTISGNTTLYAKWTINSYTVTYDSNGATSGTVPVDSTPHEYNSTVTVLANTGSLTRAAYTFAGWNTQADGGGTDYDASGTDTFNMGTANVTLYAKWTANPPTVTGVSPTSGPSSGGTSVTITGTDLTGATAVKFGSTDATSFTVDANTRITATSPAGSVGTVHITVSTAGGTTTTGSADQFTYMPTVTGVAVGHGVISCDSPVTYGSDSICTITPDPGYRLSALTDNSGDILSSVTVDQVTITNVTEAHTVTATFSAANYGGRAVTAATGDTGLYASTRAADGTQHLVYERDGNLYYRVSTLTSGSWSEEEIAVTSGHDPSLGLQQDGTPVIAFIFGDHIYTTTRTGGAWSAPVDTNVIGAGSVELAVDAGDHLHLAYTAVGDAGYDDILYGNNSGGSFAGAATICHGEYADGVWTFCRTPQLRADADGKYHLVYNKQQINNNPGAHDPQWMVYVTNSGSGATAQSHDLNGGSGSGTPQQLARGSFGYDSVNGYTLAYGNDLEDAGLWLATGLETGTWSETSVAVAGTLPAQDSDATAATRHLVSLSPDGALRHLAKTASGFGPITTLAPKGELPFVNQVKGSVLYRAADANGVTQLYQVGIGALALLIPNDGNLGTVVVGNMTEKSYTLFNNGSASLTVESLATGNPGYAFEVSTDACSGTSLAPGASCTFTVRNSYQEYSGEVSDTLTITSDDPVRGIITLPLTMQVVEPHYPLALTISGAGQATATVAGQSDFSCSSGTCTREYDTGSSVTLTATAPVGYTFTGFTFTGDGSACCRETSCSLTISGATNVTATFTRNSYAVSTLKTGSGELTCPSPISYGDSAGCTVTPADGYRIEGVGGTCGGTLTGTAYTTNPVTASCTVEAVFAAATQHTVSVTLSGTGAGSVYSYPAGILCPTGNCNALFDDASAVSLNAVPDADSTFTTWSGACTNASGPCELVLTADQSVTASFAAAPRAMVGATGYGTLTDAYGAATSGAVIQARSVTFTEALILNLNNAVTLEGGFNAEYDCNNCSDHTVLSGSLTVSNGCVVIENMSIK